TVNPISFSRAKRTRPGESLGEIGTFVPSAAVPAFPGAQKIASTRGDWRNFQARACSRPPPPTMSSFIERAFAPDLVAFPTKNFQRPQRSCPRHSPKLIPADQVVTL